MSSSFVRICFFARTLSFRKTPPTLYPYSEGFCTKLFSKKLPSLLVAQLLQRLYEKTWSSQKILSLLVGIKIAVLTACFQKNQNFFAVQNVSLFNPTLKAVFDTLLCKFFNSGKKIFYALQ